LTIDPALTAEELGEYLDHHRGTPYRKEVELRPLPVDSYPLETRALDLVERIIAAKRHGADAIFLSQPFDKDRRDES
jgi:hypothetical protein